MIRACPRQTEEQHGVLIGCPWNRVEQPVACLRDLTFEFLFARRESEDLEGSENLDGPRNVAVLDGRSGERGTAPPASIRLLDRRQRDGPTSASAACLIRLVLKRVSPDRTTE
jgi:hypothetical protein